MTVSGISSAFNAIAQLAQQAAQASSASRPDQGNSGSWIEGADETSVIGHGNNQRARFEDRRNSVELLAKMFEEGADAIEIDIQFLGDGTPILAHDNEGYSDIGKGRVEEFLNARDRDGLGHPYPPTLEEWAAVIENGLPGRPGLEQSLDRLNVFVEFKEDSMLGHQGPFEANPFKVQDDRDNLAGALEILRNAGIGGERIVAASFDGYILERLQEVDPNLTIGLFAERGDDVTLGDVQAQLEQVDADIDFVSLNDTHLAPSPEGLAAFFESLRPQSRQEENQEFIDTLRTINGVNVVFAATSEPNRDTAGQLDGLSAIITDVPAAVRDEVLG